MEKPARDNHDICFCPLSGLLDVVARKWSLLIIAVLGNSGEKGFNELKHDLGAISPKTLSDTLKQLEQAGLVEKKILPTSPPAVRYLLTGEGIELREHLIPMLVWVSSKGAVGLPGCPIHHHKQQ